MEGRLIPHWPNRLRARQHQPQPRPIRVRALLLAALLACVTSPIGFTGLGEVPHAAAQATCPSTWQFQHNWQLAPASDPAQPAVLLVHGLGGSASDWTRPSGSPYLFDFQHTPAFHRVGDDHDSPNAGVYKVGPSDRLVSADDSASW